MAHPRPGAPQPHPTLQMRGPRPRKAIHQGPRRGRSALSHPRTRIRPGLGRGAPGLQRKLRSTGIVVAPGTKFLKSKPFQKNPQAMFALRKVINGRISLSERNLSRVGWYSREAQLPALHSRLSAAPFRAAEKPSERPSLPEDRPPSGSWNTTPCIPGPGCGQWRPSYGDSVAYFGGQALAWPLCPRAWLKPVCPPGFAWATPGRPLITLTHPAPPPAPAPRQDPGDSDSQTRETPFVWPAWQRGRGQLWLPLGWGRAWLH